MSESGAEIGEKIVIGIDPGASGGAVVLTSDMEEILYTVDFGEEKDRWIGALTELFLMCMEKHTLMGVYLEDVNAMPNQGVVSMFEFGRRFGMILGMLHGLRLGYRLIRPQAWQAIAENDCDPVDNAKHKVRSTVVSGGDRKLWSWSMAVKYWGESWFVGKRGGKRDGISDAALIARAGCIEVSIYGDICTGKWDRDIRAGRKVEAAKKKARQARREKDREEGKVDKGRRPGRQRKEER